MKTAWQITTKRLLMRPIASNEGDRIHRLWTDPEVRRYLFDDEVISRGVVEDEIALSERNFEAHGAGLWSVYESDGSELLGVCGYRAFHNPEQLELIYSLDPAAWGRGFATEASRILIAWGFRVCEMDRVVASTDPPNTASVAVMHRLGMKFSGRHRTGELDSLVYEIDEETFTRQVSV